MEEEDEDYQDTGDNDWEKEIGEFKS